MHEALVLATATEPRAVTFGRRMTFATRREALGAQNPGGKVSTRFFCLRSVVLRVALLLILATFGLGCLPAWAVEYLVFAKQAQSSVLLDGECKEPFWKDIAPTVVEQEMKLRFAFDGQFVTICIDLPEASLPSIDMWISTPALARSMRLHSSAQIGQAERKTIGWSDAIEWGRNDGWYAPPIPIQGMVVRGNLRRPLFRTVTQREVQLDTRHFGFGEWRFYLQVTGVGSKRSRLRFPEADESMPDKWATLKILPLKR